MNVLWDASKDASREGSTRYYDVRGRMLTRKVSTDENPSTFEWHGMNMVREVDASGNVTQYFVIRGVIRSFLRGGVTYQVHSSAQGHVRLMTDASGDVVFSARYDATTRGGTRSALRTACRTGAGCIATLGPTAVGSIRAQGSRT